MNNLLERIKAYKIQEIAVAKAAVPISELKACCLDRPQVRGFYRALKTHHDAGSIGLIAEIKKASPSKGTVRQDFDPAALAAEYELGGAACLSVLTDEPSFRGSLKYLESAQNSSSLPLLRKDFILDPYQVYEARLWGADCILLIMRMLNDEQAAVLFQTATDLGMDALVEVHDEKEIERALKLPALLIGINNRDLGSFGLSLETSEKLAPYVPDDRLIVSESGIFNVSDCQRLRKIGINLFLVGESLLREKNVAEATRRLLQS
ncbi:indole-3-glycerol phosphate synthase TrpC [Agrobacterium pusense]|uniref:indole-3-glycerol phosphate synthase TrpC n=1 Tax=Agrobacterium pusense TaxID=648995 RepID=UPI00156BCBFC|nr:indole-3-glycerol phosphate synthase TrpC [Agrobacterium pusense]QKJ94743.1 indole-3-glycerol phosphate synthase TrpC [Agrobacterium pusense]